MQPELQYTPFMKISSLPKSLKQSFVHTPASIRLAWKASPSGSLAIALLTVLSALLPLSIAYVGKIIVDSVVAHSHDETLRWVLVELALIAGQALVQRLLFLLRSLLGAKLGHDVNVMILEKALHLELRHFENPDFYDSLTKARREASSRPVAMVTDTLQLFQNVLTLVGYAALLFSFSSWAVAGLLLAALPATLSEMRYSNAAFRLRNWRSADSRRLNYIEYVIANDEHVKEVKILGVGPMLLERYRKLGQKFYDEDKQLSIRRSTWAFLLSLLATGAFYSCYLLIALATAAGKLSLGSMTLYIVAFRQGQTAFQSCLTAIGSMYEHNLYMSNLFEYLAIPTGESTVRPKLSQTVASKKGIVFANVGFQYPGREEWALRNIHLEIPPGQSIAFVGHNGAGKTTLIKLLTRLYRPTEGQIFLDGIDLEDWDAAVLRKRFGVVFQDFNQYQFTVRENVALGNAEHFTDDGKVRTAIDQAGGSEMLGGFSSGLETPLGRWFKDGVELSGGQWQKIALARAFIREDADILILDEPTAALDAEAEHAIFERFQLLTRGRTSFLISHRFPTVRMADRILVIEHGKITEEGTHQSLLGAGGRYANLFALQAQGYL